MSKLFESFENSEAFEGEITAEILESSQKENNQMKNEILPKRHFNPIRKHKIEMDKRTLRRCLLKRIGADSLSFQDHLNNKSSLRNLIKTIKTLKKIKLNHRLYQSISNKSLTYIVEVLKNFPLLQSVNLTFAPCNVADLHVKNICHVFKNLTSLKDICLDFSNCGEGLDTTFKDAGACFKRIPSLKNITLCSSSQISDFRNMLVGQRIKRFASLKSLNFNFGVCMKMTDAPLLQLGNRLHAATSLQSLDLSFGFCFGITDTGLLSITNSLKSLIFLENIALSFSGSNISDASLNSIADGFSVLNSLKSISLCFKACRKIIGTGLCNISTSLGNYTKLISLTLDFNCCKGIMNTDAKLSEIGNSLRTITSLQNCAINFGGCAGVTDTGICALIQGLKMHISLQNLTLDFTSCPDITDTALYHLSVCLKTCLSLEIIRIMLPQAKAVTSKGASSIAESLKRLPNKLKDYHLFFPEGISQEYSIFY